MSATPGGGAAAARIARCPRCGASSRLDAQNPWRPFCSERCRLVDLGDWLDGRNAIPGEPVDSSGRAPGED